MWTKLRTIIVQSLEVVLLGAVGKILRMLLVSCTVGSFLLFSLWFNDLVEALVGFFPQTTEFDLTIWVAYYKFANAWFPVFETVVAVGAFWTFRGTMVVVNWLGAFVTTGG